MPKRKGQKLAPNVVGAAIIRDQIRGKREQYMQAKKFAAEDAKFELNQQTSITEETTLDEFLAKATLANRDFTAERDTHIITLDENGITNDYNNTFEINEQQKEAESKKHQQLIQLLKEGGYRHLPIPRRPEWTKGITTKEELEGMENRSFLEWRRGIADFESELIGLHVTPFEKNIQFWRQLWRVSERSNLLIQVVDARNPLLFRCRDLEDWIKSMPGKKQNFLLLNKADFLNESLRQEWANYFEKENIPFCFFSAKLEQLVIDGHSPSRDINDDEPKPTDILTRRQLIKFIRKHLNHIVDEIPTIGTVGYPNVGKSSVINVLCKASNKDHASQRVSVSATPGHTKHFQTLVISSDESDEDKNKSSLTLCDCPGLVFPCFVASKSEMLCFGILPIDEIRGRDWVRAIELVCQHVPKQELESTYYITLGDAWNNESHIINLLVGHNFNRASKLIEAYCKTKNLYAGGGHGARLDEGKAARIILKDVVAGKLVWCERVPSINTKEVDESIKINNKNNTGTEFIFFSRENEDNKLDDDSLIKTTTNTTTNLDQEVQDLLASVDLNDIIPEENLNMLEEDGLAKKPIKSKRLLKHGRKHRKARDVEPYLIGSAVGAVAVGKFGSTNFTRKTNVTL